MRLIQLDPEGPRPGGEPAPDEAVLDFHPRLTVITGLGPAGRERVLRAMTALPSGADPGCAGLVEAHGVILDLDAPTLDLLGLHADLDVLVRADDLPVAGRAAPVRTEMVGRTSAEHFLAITPEGRHPELDEARRAQQDARAALGVLRESAEGSRRDLDAAVLRRERAEAALEAARRGDAAPTGPAAALTPEQAAARRAELDAAAEAHRADIERAERGLAELTALDVRSIQVLLDAIRNPQEVEYVPSERAIELADEVAVLRRRVEEVEDRLDAAGVGPGPALRRLEEARARVAAAEQALAMPTLSAEDVAELEAAHDAVLEAEQRVSGPFGRRSQKRLDEAMAKQQVILDRVGFPTWSAYVMGGGLMSVDPMAEVRLEQARFELEAAEGAWADVTARLEADPQHRALLDQLEEVYLEAYDLLGGEEPDDLEASLRDLKVPKQEISLEELVDALVYQLELVGLHLPEPVGVELATTAAEAFLAEAAGIGARVEELRAERREAEHRLHDVEQERSALEVAAETTAHPSDPGDELAEAGRNLARLEAALNHAGADEAAVADSLEARSMLVDAATQVEAVATSRLMRIAAELAAQEADQSAMTDPAYDVDAADTEIDAVQEAIEFYLLTRLAAQRTVSFAGSVPMVLDDALAEVDDGEIRELLVKLERMAEAVQIVYLSDDDRVVRWAEHAGIERVAVVPAPPALAAG